MSSTYTYKAAAEKDKYNDQIINQMKEEVNYRVFKS